MLYLAPIKLSKNGVISVAPDEQYADAVYGKERVSFSLYSKESLVQALLGIVNSSDDFKQKILTQQKYLRTNELNKGNNICEVFDNILESCD